jgi:hypothetical protein
LNSNKFYIHGGLACIYFLAAISTFLTGLAAFFERSLDDKSVTTGTATTTDLKLDPFTLVLPVIVFIFDCDMRRVYRRREKYIILPFKLAFWAFFYLIIGLAGKDEFQMGSIASHKDLIKFSNFMFLIWPCVGVVYSYCLTKFSLFTLPIAGGPGLGDPDIGSEEHLQRFQNMMNERAEQFEQRQYNFDEQNFRPVGAGEEVVVIDINREAAQASHQDQIVMLSQEDLDNLGALGPDHADQPRSVNLSTRLQQQHGVDGGSPAMNSFLQDEMLHQQEN